MVTGHHHYKRIERIPEERAEDNRLWFAALNRLPGAGNTPVKAEDERLRAHRLRQCIKCGGTAGMSCWCEEPLTVGDVAGRDAEDEEATNPERYEDKPRVSQRAASILAAMVAVIGPEKFDAILDGCCEDCIYGRHGEMDTTRGCGCVCHRSE